MYEQEEIKRIIESEKKPKFINPFVIILLLILPLYLPYSDPLNPSRLATPQGSVISIVFYQAIVFFALFFGVTMYFRTYGCWRLP